MDEEEEEEEVDIESQAFTRRRMEWSYTARKMRDEMRGSFTLEHRDALLISLLSLSLVQIIFPQSNWSLNYSFSDPPDEIFSPRRGPNWKIIVIYDSYFPPAPLFSSRVLCVYVGLYTYINVLISDFPPAKSRPYRDIRGWRLLIERLALAAFFVYRTL